MYLSFLCSSWHKAPKTLGIYCLCDNEMTPGETEVASGWESGHQENHPCD